MLGNAARLRPTGNEMDINIEIINNRKMNHHCLVLYCLFSKDVNCQNCITTRPPGIILCQYHTYLWNVYMASALTQRRFSKNEETVSLSQKYI